MKLLLSITLLAAFCLPLGGRAAFAEDSKMKPNVILVITDDQGYGDLACHGNPVLETPHLDKLYRESVRLTQYHVGTTCSPTRAMLMSGRHNNAIGVWHTVQGRSLLRQDLVSMAEVFAAAGYRTGMVGKWHLGDNFPFRPQDSGFQETIYHKNGGVGGLHDAWGNDYYDDTFFRDGVPEALTGYCTDVWFQEALQFIERNAAEPFFCYISTNAPHMPFRVPERYSNLYVKRLSEVDGFEKLDERTARELPVFYGMISCIDENIGRLRAKVEELGIAENTIFIFTTDNGTALGHHFFNAGMRGKKGEAYEGGHRVPFFLHWPAGGYGQGRDISTLTAGYDVLPSLIDLCGLESDAAFDGISFVPALHGKPFPKRTLICDTQRVLNLTKYKDSCVMTQRWRLVHQEELYDMDSDPGQERDVAARFPEVVKQLQDEYERWWELVSADDARYNYIVIGSDQENPTVLTAHDVLAEEKVIFNQNQVTRFQRPSLGPWAVEVAQRGRYRFTASPFPLEVARPIRESVGEVTEISFKIGAIQETKQVRSESTHATFEVDLEEGEFMLQAEFRGGTFGRCNAFFVTVERL